MNYEDIKNMSDEEVADKNKELSTLLAKEILRAMMWRIIIAVGFHLLFKWMSRNKK